MFFISYEPYLDGEEYFNYLVLVGETDDYLKSITRVLKRREISPFFRDDECMRFFWELKKYTDANLVEVISLLEKNGYTANYKMTKLFKRALIVFNSK
jgi:hypothetical protein